MTQQTEYNDPGMMTSSLRAKLRQFADGLTLEEQAQLRSLQTERIAKKLSPVFAAKVEQAAAGLSPEDEAQLHLLVERAGVGAVAGEETDAQGHMIAQDRVLPGPEGRGGGGGFGFGPFGDMSVEAKWIAIGVGVIAGLFGGSPAPQPGQP